MKKVLLICLALCMVFLMVAVVSAADKDKTETVNGWIADSKCGAKGANAGAEACTKKCLAAGAKMVVVTDSDQKVLTVDNPDALKGHEGHQRAAAKAALSFCLEFILGPNLLEAVRSAQSQSPHEKRFVDVRSIAI